MSSNIDIFDKVYGKEDIDIFDKVYGDEKTQKFRPGAGGKAALRGILKAAKGFSGAHPLSALTPKSPAHEKVAEEFIEEKLKDPEAGFSEKIIERGVETLPYLLGGEGALASKVGRAGLSSLLGQTAEEADLGEIPQVIAESIGLSLPGLGKKILPRKGQEKILETLRRRGLSEKEIAPLIPSASKAGIITPIAKKGGRGRRAVERTQKALGRVYSQLEEEGSKTPILASRNASLLESNLSDIVEKFPSEVKRLIQDDVRSTFKKPVKSGDLMDLWFKINDQIFDKKLTKKKSLLNQLKTPILGAMEEIDPSLAKDFEILQNSYSHFKRNISKSFNPNFVERWLKLTKVRSFIVPLLSGSLGGIKGLATYEAPRMVATEFLVNPRLQNLTKQMIKAVNSNKISIAKKIEGKMIEELKKKAIEIHSDESIKS